MAQTSLRKEGQAKLRLLFITQKIHQADDDLAFVTLWVEQFVKEGFNVSVIALEKREFDGSFPVYSLGKEDGVGKFGRTMRFLHLITTLKYDRVFVHMNPEYFTLGGWWWVLRKIPIYFWYTHYTMTFHVWFGGLITKRMFAATPQSLPQYNGNPKKVILGHGIDVPFWGPPPSGPDPDGHEIISVHRLSRSKRLDIALHALKLLPENFTLTVYGRPIDPVYYAELNDLVNELELGTRVKFMGPVPMPELRAVYPHRRLMLNMAHETIDKTMLEGMLFGIYPVTTPGNAKAIGLQVHPSDETPEAIAAFIEGGAWQVLDRQALRTLVEERHSLAALVSRMSDYIRAGT